MSDVSFSAHEERDTRSKQPVVTAARVSAGALILVLALVPWIVKLDGHPHADWEQFLGRFHPLTVHLPIGLLVLVPLLEIAGARRKALREAAGFVLALALLSCFLALVLGVLLAHGSGAAGVTVTRHLVGAVVLTICTLLCMMARPLWAERAGVASAQHYAYPALLAFTLLALTWTAHQGGSITHGSNYLTQYLPAALKRGGASPAALQASFYGKHIHPILDSNCASCHSESQAKGGLRVDSYDLLMRGGNDGAVIVAGAPEKSLLLQRVTLPQGHEKFMPAEGRPPLRPEQIAWLRAWIAQGASESVTALNGISIREDRAEEAPKPVGDYSALMPEVRAMQSKLGAKLMPVSAKPEDGLVLFTVDAGAQFGDADLAQFQKFAPYIVDAELARTSVTDASMSTLAQFTHLHALHLEGTQITGAGIEKLKSLQELSYLNLSGTKVSAAAAAQFKTMPKLRRLYLYDTPAEPATSAEKRGDEGGKS